jgi:hypothetical protein
MRQCGRTAGLARTSPALKIVMMKGMRQPHTSSCCFVVAATTGERCQGNAATERRDILHGLHTYHCERTAMQRPAPSSQPALTYHDGELAAHEAALAGGHHERAVAPLAPGRRQLGRVHDRGAGGAARRKGGAGPLLALAGASKCGCHVRQLRRSHWSPPLPPRPLPSRRAHPYSPPTARPCTTRSSAMRMGAAMPMVW